MASIQYILKDSGFGDQLASAKQLLKPTQTVVKTLPCVDDAEDERAPTCWVKTDEGWKEVPVKNGAKGADPAAPPQGDARMKATHAEMHGSLGDRRWAAPRLVTYCDVEARTGYNSKKAHEYLDDDEVLRAKVALLAQLVRRSKQTIAYTGAGISTASGIPDYGTRTTSGLVKATGEGMSPYEACPTKSHRVMASLHRRGRLYRWVQQNHDGLPQKAGFPQAAINEIHGGWFDPSNPTVPMNGMLRRDLLDDMCAVSKTADLCLALGTTMCGMTADLTATEPAKRSRNGGESIGTVIVNLQQTQHDHMSALRIFARIDDVMVLLAKELEIPEEEYVCSSTLAEMLSDGPRAAVMARCRLDDHVYSVPYDSNGVKIVAGSPGGLAEASTLDLREGARVRICGGMYDGDEGEVTGMQREGHYKITIVHNVKNGPLQARVCVILGLWFVEAACDGSLSQIPVVNI